MHTCVCDRFHFHLSGEFLTSKGLKIFPSIPVFIVLLVLNSHVT